VPSNMLKKIYIRPLVAEAISALLCRATPSKHARDVQLVAA
jgi:hypothetical protein